jgi:hypothetical protein
MKKISILTSLTLFVAAVLLLSTTGCSKDDDPAPIDVNAVEKDLVGLWWDEFKYADVTETGEAFSRVLLVVEADEDHTGCIYLGVFNDTSDEPIAIYGGPKDAGFTWKVLSDGRIELGDPETGETLDLAPALTRGSSYGSNMTNTSNTNLTYSNGSVTVTNGNQSNTLNKANAEQTATIEQKLSTGVNSNVDLESGGKTPNDFGSGDIR